MHESGPSPQRHLAMNTSVPSLIPNPDHKPNPNCDTNPNYDTNPNHDPRATTRSAWALSSSSTSPACSTSCGLVRLLTDPNPTDISPLPLHLCYPHPYLYITLNSTFVSRPRLPSPLPLPFHLPLRSPLHIPFALGITRFLDRNLNPNPNPNSSYQTRRLLLTLTLSFGSCSTCSRL